MLVLLYAPWVLFGTNRITTYGEASAEQSVSLLDQFGRTLATFVLSDTVPADLKQIAWLPLALALVAILIYLARRDKLRAGVEALERMCPDSPTRFEAIQSRLLPDNARELVRDADIVVEGSDNFATKFLCADTCFLERKPIVQGAAVRWITTALSCQPAGRPCYRCLFEDLPPRNQAPNCAEAGVLGSVVGFGAALMAELTLRVVYGRPGPIQQLAGPSGHVEARRRRHVVSGPEPLHFPHYGPSALAR